VKEKGFDWLNRQTRKDYPIENFFSMKKGRKSDIIEWESGNLWEG